MTDDALTWSGKFHATGARRLPVLAPDPGRDGAFTIHDCEDHAHLMNLVRDQLGFSKTRNHFSP